MFRPYLHTLPESLENLLVKNLRKILMLMNGQEVESFVTVIEGKGIGRHLLARRMTDIGLVVPTEFLSPVISGGTSALQKCQLNLMLHEEMHEHRFLLTKQEIENGSVDPKMLLRRAFPKMFHASLDSPFVLYHKLKLLEEQDIDHLPRARQETENGLYYPPNDMLYPISGNQGLLDYHQMQLMNEQQNEKRRILRQRELQARIEPTNTGLEPISGNSAL